ncbi:VOC family protein [Litorilinea aerophila]|uniref:VOC domain-containing protein n=1 Tax=Litorilinea aerophila TaxID=1204385 RepID=A0A540VAE4_9CHLR|nr:VOC family protein [Litorilinea aerophila]MCC9078408.1 VOC family protein [Litorilinea aerophila]GIV76050.1 MAG: VOC family protein [Litorilinea sp.]
MQLKATHHVALRTPNFAAMEQFYTQTLGLPVTRRWDDVQIVFIDVGSTTIELIGRDDATAETKPTGGWDHIAFHVEDVDAAFQELVEKGVRIRSEPRNFKEVRIAFFYDPDGNVLELVEDPRKDA